MLSEELLAELQEYIDRHKLNVCLFESIHVSIGEGASRYDIENFVNSNLKASFNQLLFKFIDKKAVSDIEVYKKACIDRRHFSKIRSNKDYHPSKKTVITLALALELDIEDTDKLLNSAGFTLSQSDTFDLVIQFCLEKEIYNIYDVNLALDYFSLEPLTGQV